MLQCLRVHPCPKTHIRGTNKKHHRAIENTNRSKSSFSHLVQTMQDTQDSNKVADPQDAAAATTTGGNSKKHPAPSSDDDDTPRTVKRAASVRVPTHVVVVAPSKQTPEETMIFIDSLSHAPTQEEAAETRKTIMEKLEIMKARPNYIANIAFSQAPNGTIGISSTLTTDPTVAVGYHTFAGAPFRAGTHSILEPAGNWQKPEYGAEGPTKAAAKLVFSISRRDSELPPAAYEAQLAMAGKIFDFQDTVLVKSGSAKRKWSEETTRAAFADKKVTMEQYAVRDWPEFMAGTKDFANIPITVPITPMHRFGEWPSDKLKDKDLTPEERKEKARIRISTARAAATAEWDEVTANPVFYGAADLATGEPYGRSDSALVDLRESCLFLCNGLGHKEAFPGFKYVKVLTRDGSRILSAQSLAALSQNIGTCIFIPIMQTPYLSADHPSNFSFKADFFMFLGRLPLPTSKSTINAPPAFNENSGLF